MLAARQPGPRKPSLEEQAKKLQEQKRIQQGKEMCTRLVATAEEEQAKASKAAQKAAKKVEKTRKAQESLAETVSHARKHAKQHILPRDSSEDDADVAGKAQKQAWQAALLQMSASGPSNQKRCTSVSNRADRRGKNCGEKMSRLHLQAIATGQNGARIC